MGPTLSQGLAIRPSSKWQDHRLGLGRQLSAVSRFVLIAVCLCQMTFGSETFPHDLPTRPSIWDMASGKPLEILTGDQAANKRAAAKAWRDAGSTSGDVIVKSDNNTVVDLVSAKMNTVLARVYITPPFQMNVNTCRVNVTTKRVAFFTTSNTFLVYEVDL